MRPAQWSTQESGNGAAPARGRHLTRGAHCPGGRHVKIFFFVCAAGKAKMVQGSLVQRWPVENHLLHNEVAQVRIEEQINAEAI